jgi:hypothetical protein
MKKLIELQTQLHDQFLSWFQDIYTKWEDEVIEKLKPKVKEIISNNPNPAEEIHKMDFKFLVDKIEFIKNSQYKYIDIVLDQYNDKKITKREMNVFCKELMYGIKETEIALNNMKEKHK